ncbi:unnamed protein product [Strongylus vulgaris]|uniref:Uncharacterized protein n=1 Tax=Strongylus vulgaris TaxID=40348 RepID=A0A3P7LG11_STRVU|nr:unnamed protein product [Strongylus vulgaris]
MAVYICVELPSISGLPDIMNCLLERSIKFTVSKDRNSLCERCSARNEFVQSPGCSYLQSLPQISTPSSASLELMDMYPRSESVDSEPSENVKEETSLPHMNEAATVKDEIEEADLVASGSELLQQVSANFSSYQEKAQNFTDSEVALVREKGTGSAAKQCQQEGVIWVHRGKEWRGEEGAVGTTRKMKGGRGEGGRRMGGERGIVDVQQAGESDKRVVCHRRHH